MTDVFAVVQSLGPIIGDTISNYALITTSARNVGGIYPHVTLEETGRDEMMITQHPVDVGCPVSDHAFIQPWTVEIHCGFSNSTAASEGYVQTVYQSFLSLQQSAKAFSVTTGKRSYGNMLARMVIQKTVAASENSLDITVLCQYIQKTHTSMSSAGGDVPSGGAQNVNSSGAPTFNTNGIDFGSGNPQAFGNGASGLGSISPDGVNLTPSYTPSGSTESLFNQ